MPSTMPARPLRTPANSLPGPSHHLKAGMEPVRTAAKNQENAPESRRVRAIVCELLGRPTRTRKGFVDAASISEQDLSDALAGRRRFDVEWLFAQDDAFLLDLIDLIVAERRLTPEAKRIVRANQIAELTRLLQLTGERPAEATR